MIGMSFSHLMGSAEFLVGFSVSLFACAMIAAYGEYFTLRR